MYITDQIEQSRQELARLRAKGALERQRQILENDEVYRRFRAAEASLTKAIRDELPKHTPLHVYMQCIKAARAQDVAPHYAAYLEAQVCRSVHHVVVLKKQLAMVKMACDWIVDLMQLALASITDEKTQVEVHGLNSIYEVDDSKASMAKMYTVELQEQQEEKDRCVLYQTTKDNNDTAIPGMEIPKIPGIASVTVGGTKYVNVSNNVLAVVKDDKVLSFAVRNQKAKNGWKPLKMSRATRSSSLRSLNHLSRTRAAIKG